VGFKKGSMKPLPRYDFSIIEIVGFYAHFMLFSPQQ
jgi:hypothetical protein